MKLLTYHFLRYDTNLSSDYYLKNYSDSTVLCFDLEDSIQDICDFPVTVLRKQQSREALEFVVRSNSDVMKELNIGIRLNQLSSAEFNKDISLLSSLKGCLNKLTLFLPKTESAGDIQTLGHILHEAAITYADIVTIIETKEGMHNLPSILSKRSDSFNTIAFGHCDYNFDSKIFPFHHQDSAPYWAVVDKMLTTAEENGCTFINSTCLHLDYKEFFDAMLSRLIENSHSEAIGQIVLTHKQADWCRSFLKTTVHTNDTLRSVGESPIHKHNFSSESSSMVYAKELIAEYESNRNGKAFSISGTKRVLISPHEYLAAKRHLQYG